MLTYLGPRVILRLNKVFNFHLLKLSAAENKIARSDFVAEGLANLSDAKGDLKRKKIRVKIERTVKNSEFDKSRMSKEKSLCLFRFQRCSQQ